MGVDTNAYILNTTKEEVFEFIKSAIDSNAKIEETPYQDYIVVNFMFKEEKRSINLHQSVIDVKADMKRWKTDDPLKTDSGSFVEDGIPDKSKGVFMSLRKWGSSISIMRILAKYFEGYIDDDDSDLENYYYIKKDLRELMREIWSGRPIQ